MPPTKVPVPVAKLCSSSDTIEDSIYNPVGKMVIDIGQIVLQPGRTARCAELEAVIGCGINEPMPHCERRCSGTY